MMKSLAREAVKFVIKIALSFLGVLKTVSVTGDKDSVLRVHSNIFF